MNTRIHGCSLYSCCLFQKEGDGWLVDDQVKAPVRANCDSARQWDSFFVILGSFIELFNKGRDVYIFLQRIKKQQQMNSKITTTK